VNFAAIGEWVQCHDKPYVCGLVGIRPMEEPFTSALPPRDRVVRALRELLSEGTLGSGERLPSERILAQRLGASRDTVRSALRDLASRGLISPSRARMRRMIVAGPGSAAAGGSSLMAKTIALFSDFPISPDRFASMPKGFESRVFTESASLLQSAGLHVLAIQSSTFTENDVASLVGHQIGGMILLVNFSDSEIGVKTIEVARARHIPLVTYGNSKALESCDRCWSDHEAGAYQLTQWLIARGKKRVQPFWRFAAPHYWLQCREIGYQRAMRDAGLTPLEPIRTPDLALGDGNRRESFEHAVRMIAGYIIPATAGPDAADAFMVASDPHAYELSAALQLIGRRPEAFPIVGYDNSYLALPARAWSPKGPDATMEKDNSAIGRELATLLLDRMNNRLPPEPQMRLVAPRLIEVESPPSAGLKKITYPDSN
jgi:DNA-binding LacI/PurR family transcriptional regulator